MKSHVPGHSNIIFNAWDLNEYQLENEITSSHLVGRMKDGQLGYFPSDKFVSGMMGWARYDDTQYTTSSVFNLTVLGGELTLPNNSGYSVTEHLHSSVQFYNSGSQKIQAENNADVYMCTVVFKAKTANANGTYIRLQLDSTGLTPYERVGKDLFFGKGNDSWHDFHEVFQYYADNDFVTNGNRWKVQAFGDNVSIANIIFFIQRTQYHKN